MKQEAEKVYNFWREYLKGKNYSAEVPQSGKVRHEYANLDEIQQQKIRERFIHPHDLESLQTIGAARNFSRKAESARKEIGLWTNGIRPRTEEYATDIYPSIPQPFMGNLENPRILIVTFNPGFHNYVDWTLGNNESSLKDLKTNKDLIWETKFDDCFIEFPKGAKILDILENTDAQIKLLKQNNVHSNEAIDTWRDYCRLQWRACQDTILEAIRGGAPTQPWPFGAQSETTNDPETSAKPQSKRTLYPTEAKRLILPPPLNFYPARDGSARMFSANWHETYFNYEKEYSLLNLLHKSEGDNNDICQIEVFPYQSDNSGSVSSLFDLQFPNSGKDSFSYESIQNRLLASQIIAFEYIQSFIAKAKDNNRLVLIRGSINKYPGIEHALFGDSGLLHDVETRSRVLSFVSQNCYLTAGNLRQYGPKMNPMKIEELLQGNLKNSN